MDESPQITGPQLKSLAEEIHNYQLGADLSDTALCKRFGQIGSTKTYRRILTEDFDGMDLERQHFNLTQVVALITAELAAGETEEQDFDDLDHVKAARLAIVEAMREKGNNRLVVIEGQSGSGKTKVLRMIAGLWANVTIVEADVTWTSRNAMLSDIIMALNPIHRRPNETQIPFHIEAKKRKVEEILNTRKRILCFDEAHHVSVEGLNYVKTLINRTPSVIVLAAIPILLKRIEKDAYEECRQLWRNRLSARVHLNGPPEPEAILFLERRGVKFADPKTARQCANILCKTAPTYGNWNFVNLVARAARKEGNGQPITLEQFTAAQQTVINTR